MKEVEEFIEKLEPNGLEQRTILCSFFIATLENLKQTIIKNIQMYYGEEHIVDGKKHFKNFNKSLPVIDAVRSEHFDDFARYLYASSELGIINNKSIELLRKCFRVRNDVAHGNTMLYILEEEKNKVLEENLVLIYNISYEWKTKWYWTIENEKLQEPLPFHKDYLPDSHVVFYIINKVFIRGEELEFGMEEFEPTNLKRRALISCFYIMVLENMRLNISENIKEFFGDFKFKNGEICYENYEEKINKYGKGPRKHFGKDFAPFLYASKQIGIISQEQIEALAICCTIRNDIVHNTISYILYAENSNTALKYLSVLYEIFCIWDENWFWEVENATSPDPIPKYIEGIVPGNHYVLRAIYKILFEDREFYYEMKTEYESILRTNGW